MSDPMNVVIRHTDHLLLSLHVTYANDGTYVVMNDKELSYLLANKYFTSNTHNHPLMMQEIPNWIEFMAFSEEHIMHSVQYGKMYSFICRVRECSGRLLLATNSEELFSACINNLIGKMVFAAFEDTNYITFRENVFNRGFMNEVNNV
jgi:hypothetical protein